MRWEDFRRSDNVEDRRGETAYAGGRQRLGGGGGHLGLGAVIVLGLIGWALGIDPGCLIGGAEMVNGMRSGGPHSQSAPRAAAGADRNALGPDGPVRRRGARRERGRLGDVLPAQKGVAYVKPKLVLYSGSTRSGCGGATRRWVLLLPERPEGLSRHVIFRDMKRRLGGGGDFAYAYVISHEIGHHIQNLLGILPQGPAAQQRADEQGARRMRFRCASS